MSRLALSDFPPIGGTTLPEFSELRREFVKNFAERGDLGAACAVYYRGRKVVDLWGGYRDLKTRAPWNEDTLVLVFSTTKGIAAMVMAVAHSRRLFQLDDPVAKHWPQFAQGGKAQITVRELLAHQAGLPVIDERLCSTKLADLDRLAEIIARQSPVWQPGTRHGYHTLTLGWYQNELIRRVDPQGRSLGRFFQEEIAEPLDIEFYIGLPDHVDEQRIATIKGFHPLRMLLNLNKLPARMVLTAMSPRSLVARSARNPKFRRASELGGPVYRRLEIPSANGIGQARAIAKAYGDLATGGKKLGLTAETMSELTAPATAPTAGSHDAILKIESAYSFGFVRPSRFFSFGTASCSLGCPGAGGSFGFADPRQQLGFAYVSNKMGFYLFDDPREKALRDACYRCIEQITAAEQTKAPERRTAA